MVRVRYSALTFIYYKGKHYPDFSLNEIQGTLRFRYSIPAIPLDIKVRNSQSKSRQFQQARFGIFN
jgi:hypothetical protein